MAETSLFEGGEENISFEVPLAERMRPRVLDEYVGQRHVLAPGKALRSMLDGGKAPSCILYGPPGVGKTTLVRLIARTTGRVLLEINAVSAKVETLRLSSARAARKKYRDVPRSPLSMRSTISTANSRTFCCRPSRLVTSSLSVRLRKIPGLRSTRRCFRAWSSTPWNR